LDKRAYQQGEEYVKYYYESPHSTGFVLNFKAVDVHEDVVHASHVSHNEKYEEVSE